MKKKVLLAALTLACVAGGAFALAGCSGKDKEHDHDYDTTKWVKVDDNQHAHPCKEEGCNSVSGTEAHQITTETTATCTAGGTTTTACTKCDYSTSQTVEALGHDWDTENPVEAATHLKEGKLKCKHAGCTETKSVEKIAHTYVYTYKDETTHTGKCDGADCGEVPEVEKPHNYTSQQVNYYTVYTCEECKNEYTELKLTIKKRVSDTTTEDYTGASIKVALYKIGEESDTPDYEVTADSATGIATLKIAEGAYWVKVTDETSGYATADANYIRYTKSNELSNYAASEIVLSETAEYKVKFTYGVSIPATGVKVQVYPNYRYNGTVTAPVIGEGVTDSNGEVTFNLASSFDMVNANNCGLRISDYNETDYKTLHGLGFAATDKGTTKSYSFEPKQQAFTIKVKAGDDYVSGFTVKFYESEYDPETQTWSDNITSTLTATGDSVVTAVMNNETKLFYIELPDEYKDDWELPTSGLSTNTLTGETIVTLVVKADPTFTIQIKSNADTNYGHAGIKITIKNTDGDTVGEDVTDETGAVSFQLPKLSSNGYKIHIDTATLPETDQLKYAYTNGSAVFGSKSSIDKETNSYTKEVVLSAAKLAKIIVRSDDGEGNYTYYENVKVILSQSANGGGTVYCQGTTDTNGEVTLAAVAGTRSIVALENLPSGFEFISTNTQCRFANTSATTVTTVTITLTAAE